MKNRTLCCIAIATIVILTLALTFNGCQGDSASRKRKCCRIGIVYSFTPEDRGQKNVDPILKELLEAENIDAEIKSVYLDCNKYDRASEDIRMTKFLDAFEKWHPDILIPFDDQATYTMLVVNHPLTRKVPIVYCGVNFPNEKLYEKYPDNLWGVTDKPDYKKNVDFINRVMHGTRIEVVYDRTALGRIAYNKLISDIGESYPIDTSLVMLDTLSNTYQDAPTIYNNTPIEIGPDQTLITLFPFRCSYGRLILQRFHDNAYNSNMVLLFEKYDIISSMMTEFYNYPIFSVMHKRFNGGNNIIGGYFATPETLHADLAKIVTDIVRNPNVKPYTIDAEKSFNADYNEFTKWGIDSKSFPIGTNIVNEPLNKRYSNLIVGGSAMTLLILIVMVARIIIGKTKRSRIRELESAITLSRSNQYIDVYGDKYVFWIYQNGNFVLDKFSEGLITLKENIYDFQNFLSKIHDDDVRRVRESAEEKDKPGTKNITYRIHTQKDEYVWYDITYKVVHFGKNFLAIGIAKNINDKKRQEEQDRNVRHELSLFNVQHNFFHNAKTEIIGLCELMRHYVERGCIDPSARENVPIPTANMTRIYRLNEKAKNVLADFCANLPGNTHTEIRRTNLDKVIRAAYRSLIPETRKRIIISHRDLENPVFIDTNALLLTKLLLKITDVASMISNSRNITIDTRQDSKDAITICVKTSKLVYDVELIKSILTDPALKSDKCYYGLGLEIPACRLFAMRLGGKFSTTTSADNVEMNITLPITHKVAR